MFASTNQWNGTSYKSRIEDPKSIRRKTGTAQVKRITEEQRELDLETSQILTKTEIMPGLLLLVLIKIRDIL